MQKTYKIEGMDCAACAKMIELDLEDANIKANCSYETGELVTELADKSQSTVVENTIKEAGYKIV
jgi:cation transport ATPase